MVERVRSIELWPARSDLPLDRSSAAVVIGVCGHETIVVARTARRLETIWRGHGACVASVSLLGRVNARGDEEDRMTDQLGSVVIVGGGPAGASAATFTARAGLTTVVIDADKGMTRRALVENHLGFPDGITGPDLVDGDAPRPSGRAPTWVEGTAEAIERTAGRVHRSYRDGQAFDSLERHPRHRHQRRARRGSRRDDRARYGAAHQVDRRCRRRGADVGARDLGGRHRGRA